MTLRDLFAKVARCLARRPRRPVPLKRSPELLRLKAKLEAEIARVDKPLGFPIATVEYAPPNFALLDLGDRVYLIEAQTGVWTKLPRLDAAKWVMQG